MTTPERSKEEASPVTNGKIRKIIKTGGKIEECAGSIIWLYMQQEHALTPGQLVQLQRATIPAKIHGRTGTLVRIFAQNSPEAKNVNVKDFDSLNEHPSLILYEGYYFKNGGPGDILIEKRAGNNLSLLERELQDGGITEVGLKKETSGAMKWLVPFGSFLLKGGWLLVLLLVIVIMIAVVALSK